jgi:hypothetical protein
MRSWPPVYSGRDEAGFFANKSLKKSLQINFYFDMQASLDAPVDKTKD